MSKIKYSLSFTAGAALINESVLVAKLYIELRNWADVKCAVLAENHFQCRTVSTLKRLYAEVSNRLKNLTDEQLDLLAEGKDEQAKALIWLAICRQYLIIHDFTIEVIAPHFDSARFLITHEDYDAFFHSKSEWHDELESTSQQTKYKARQVLFKMMKECQIVGDNNELQPQKIDEKLIRMIKQSSPYELRFYPGIV